jgi:hypothetical protein
VGNTRVQVHLWSTWKATTEEINRHPPNPRRPAKASVVYLEPDIARVIVVTCIWQVTESVLVKKGVLGTLRLGKPLAGPWRDCLCCGWGE